MVGTDLTGPTSTTARAPRRRGPTRRIAAIMGAVLVVASVAVLRGVGPDATSAARPDSVRILMGAAETLDPAYQGDIGSAEISAQLFEGLTAFDPQLNVQPALAESWDLLDDGRRIVFHLRPDLTFSDGSPITGDDVVRSWLRIVDPDQPSPLVSLIGDVEGALAYAARRQPRPGFGRSQGRRSRRRGAPDPARRRLRVGRRESDVRSRTARDRRGTGHAAYPAAFVGSGAYALQAVTDEQTTLVANDHYWAGRPAIPTIEIVHDIGGRSPVQAFEEDDVDLTNIFPFDATWIAYDEVLGPQLREGSSLSVNYYGFDTTRPPFDDVRVRQAFAQAVDWRRLVSLVAGQTAIGGDRHGAARAFPVGATRTSCRRTIRMRLAQLLADAGYPGGEGFPETTIMTFGSPFDAAVVEEIERELGIDLTYEVDGGDYFGRLASDPPQMWSMGWVADYPGPNDFLGILLGTGSSNNYGRWSNADFDQAITDALATTDPERPARPSTGRRRIVRDEAPVIPLRYDLEWTLSRTGLLGAQENGLGITRMAGLAWENE